ncbi:MULTISPECIES: hypothetical protein [unclassified Oceanispirochaeta]|nr:MULTISPECIES: hypothetical protein [unclassified Oceanispirochaeta]MBF9017538.1 hypothetical protein [Oceanispirochaeta sp. M2]NPD74110.1 hypothetical protein [Oceanispirochaeta sp. M1]
MFDSCMFSRLQKDNDNFNSAITISGQIIDTHERVNETSPYVLVLWPELAESNAKYWVLGSEKTFEILIAPGKYSLVAFRDDNRDGMHQEEEPSGIFIEGIDTEFPDQSLVDEWISIELNLDGKASLPPSITEAAADEVTKILKWRKDFIGSIVNIDNDIFSMSNAENGYWSPLSFFNEFGAKVYFTEPYDPSKIPVLFVHGALGTPQNFSSLIDSLDKSLYQPWVYYYPSGFDLDSVSKQLAQLMHELNITYPHESLIVVAHSMGGLVSRSAIIKYKENYPGIQIPLYLTFATPWNGHASAAKGVANAPAIVPSWYDMVPESPFIQGLYASSLPTETKHFLFFAYEGKGSLFNSENDDGSVTLSSQLYPGAQNSAERVIGINANHVGILSDAESLRIFNSVLDSYYAGDL